MRRRRLAAGLLCAGLWLTNAAPMWACAVCGGDPESNMVKGAEAGVLLMLIATYGLLLGMAAVAAVWFARSRRLAM